MYFFSSTLDPQLGAWEFYRLCTVSYLIPPGTTLDFTFLICSSCSLSPWYFTVFSYSFFLMWLSAGIVTPIITAAFCSLSTTTMNGWLVSSCLSVWNLKSHRSLAVLFPTPYGGVSHEDLGSFNPYLGYGFQWILSQLAFYILLQFAEFSPEHFWVFFAVVDFCLCESDA